MKTEKLKRIIFMIIAAFVAFSCARETELEFQDFDENEDNLISWEEFEEEFTDSYYDDWNTNDNDYLDDEDFYSKTYNMWDRDKDERLTEEEWNVGYDYQFGDYIVHGYTEIDSDGDGMLERAEYTTYLNDRGFYNDWDNNLDNSLDEEELARGVFERWDIDQSGFLEQDEYNEFDTYYLDI